MSDKRIRFTYLPQRGGYVCSEPGGNDGWYVRVPDDDGELVDEVWANSAGAQASFIDDWWQMDFDGPGFDLTILQKAICISDVDDSITLKASIKTRGDVRRLCAALGIPLKEASHA